MSAQPRILCLTGGVGGAKLALGLYKVLPAGSLTVGVNTGDDFNHLGLPIWPDFDTTLYTLAGLVDQGRGWGRAAETWTCLETLRTLGGPDWFQLGDRDLAIHLWRLDAINRGATPTEIARHLTRVLDLSCDILPVSGEPLRTVLETDEGVLDFQTYFVGRRAAPRVIAVRYEGADQARTTAPLQDLLAASDLNGVVIAPSNPLLSIGPVLAVAGLRDTLAGLAAPVVAVTPIVGGAAIKGPTAKIMSELGLPVTPVAVAQAYRDILDGFVLDEVDAALAPQIEDLGLACCIARTVMTSQADKEALARQTLDFLNALRPAAGHDDRRV